ncbi:DUF4179 domain-containing protein [Paenibacillus sp. GCM10027626]|uniref:DUF4179 domain-containing protein n=1 Tax=Paenibacillus sp. GCM10027626 TaxID=3273411 RepID=UPI0036350B50
MNEQQIQNAKRSYEVLETDVELMMEKVGKRLQSGKGRAVQRPKWMIRRMSLTAAAAAVLCTVVLGSGFISPAMAAVLKEIPIVGSIFQKVRGPGLQTAAERGMSETVGQAVHNNGVTLQIQEIIYDGDRVSIGYVQQADEGFVNGSGPWDGIDFKINGEPYSDSVHGTGTEALDSGGNTRVGQITLQPNKQKLPDQFELTIEVAAVGGIAGEWNFTIPVKKTVSDIRSMMPMLTKSDGETTLLLKKVSFKPGVVDVEVELRRPAAMAGERMYSTEVVTDRGIALEGGNMEGDGYIEGDTHVQLGTFHFDAPEQMPKSITIQQRIPETYTEDERWNKVELTGEPTESNPLVISQGAAGRLLITKIEQSENNTMVYFRTEGNDPKNQGYVVIEDKQQPWGFLSPDKQTEVDAEKYSYVSEFAAIPADQSLVFMANNLKKPNYNKKLEITLPLEF